MFLSAYSSAYSQRRFRAAKRARVCFIAASFLGLLSLGTFGILYTPGSGDAVAAPSLRSDTYRKGPYPNGALRSGATQAQALEDKSAQQQLLGDLEPAATSRASLESPYGAGEEIASASTASTLGRMPAYAAPAFGGQKLRAHEQQASYAISREAPAESSRLGSIRFNSIPTPDTIRNGRYIAPLANGDIAFLSLNIELHRFVNDLVRKAQSQHVAIVAMEPSTGRILAYAGKSKSVRSIVSHAGFPAASLFKVITSAAALERSSIEPDSLVPFRGGTYELERWNYAPNPRRDRRMMTLTEALGKSCNPVFGRVALSYLTTPILRSYAEAFGFNNSLGFEAPLPSSYASIPFDEYQLSRTGAGFGEVYISPVHAAAMMAGVANKGVMPRPSLVEGVLLQGSNKMVPVGAEMRRRMIAPATSAKLMRMMVSTTMTGTSRREFLTKGKKPLLGSVDVAAKTGTLSGNNPKGLNHWFIAAAPLSSPKIALAIISVDPRNSSARPSRLGRMIIQRYLKLD